MNKRLNVLAIGAMLAAAVMTSGCESFLDVNENPNNPLAVPARSILAQALKVTGDNVGSGYNGYGMWTAGYWAKSTIVNGFTEERRYAYTSLYQQGLWNATYDNLNDYETIIRQSEKENTPNLAAIAQIMRAYNFQLLVDEYGDIPYFNALKGLEEITPVYDNDEDIYKDLVTRLDAAIETINGLSPDLPAVGNADIVFGGNMARWKSFAQSLKLRMLMRMSNVGSMQSFITAEFAKFPANEFLTVDVLVQPGYIQALGKQNPFYDTYGVTPAGASAAQRNWVVPTAYIINQFKNNADPRLSRLFTAATGGGAAGTYQGTVLGDNDLPPVTYRSRNRIGGGLLKAYDMPQALMLLAESEFLKAEAYVRGYLAGGDAAAKTAFVNGINASFAYFYAPTPSQRGTSADQSALGLTRVTDYFAANLTNPFVNWDVETDPGTPSKTATKLEKIYFQKYLALIGALPIEAWSEVRRNDYPHIDASIESNSPRADKLPVRLLYPQSEIVTNGANVLVANQFTDRIFWDVQ